MPKFNDFCDYLQQNILQLKFRRALIISISRGGKSQKCFWYHESWYRCQIFLWKGVNSHSISAYSGRYLNKLLHCKLQSELADPTQFLLIRIGVDFVFSCHNKNKKKNPRLAFTRRNGFTWLKLGGCPVGAWRLSECCWMGVWSVSIGYLEWFQRAC